jgi:ABC-type nitrate/sulfonate/bicarbonate transport system ATPase subunit
MTTKSYLEIWNVTKTYKTPTGDAVIVHDFNLKIQEGEFVCLIGHSGCGKSTVLSMVAGLNQATKAASSWRAARSTGPGPTAGVVFQSPCLFPWMTALENVLLGVEEVKKNESPLQRRQICRALPDARRPRRRDPQEAVRVVGRHAPARRPCARLRARPENALLDEPFGMLDSLTRLELQEALWSSGPRTARPRSW